MKTPVPSSAGKIQLLEMLLDIGNVLDRVHDHSDECIGSEVEVMKVIKTKPFGQALCCNNKHT